MGTHIGQACPVSKTLPEMGCVGVPGSKYWQVRGKKEGKRESGPLVVHAIETNDIPFPLRGLVASSQQKTYLQPSRWECEAPKVCLCRVRMVMLRSMRSVSRSWFCSTRIARPIICLGSKDSGSRHVECRSLFLNLCRFFPLYSREATMALQAHRLKELHAVYFASWLGLVVVFPLSSRTVKICAWSTRVSIVVVCLTLRCSPIITFSRTSSNPEVPVQVRLALSRKSDPRLSRLNCISRANIILLTHIGFLRGLQADWCRVNPE